MTSSPGRLRLGVNIDHVATVRNARGGPYPDPLRAAKLAEAAGADGITAHLREDRRHITDADIDALIAELTLPLNLEMAATDEMQAIALRHRPHAVCIVPERREERTTEGGLEVAREENRLAHFIAPLARRRLPGVDLHRRRPPADRGGAPHRRPGDRAAHRRLLRARPRRRRRRARRRDGAARARWRPSPTASASRCMPATGSPSTTSARSRRCREVRELNIGHFLVGEAIFVGLDASIRRMREAMDAARAAAGGRDA